MNSILRAAYWHNSWSLIFLLGLIGLSTPSFCQTEEPFDHQPIHHIDVEIASFKITAHPDSVRTDIYIAVPYSFLFFQNAVDRYVADYQVTLEVRDSATDSLLITRQKENNISLETGVMEKLKELDESRADASQERVILPASHSYRIAVRVVDLSKRDRAEESQQYRTPNYNSTAFAMSDMLIYRSRSGGKLIPNIGSDISALIPEEAGAFFELYNAPQSAPLWVVNLIVDTTNAELARTVTVLVPGGKNREAQFSKLFSEELWTGKYRLLTAIVPSATDTALTSNGLREKALAYRTHKLRVGVGHGVPLVSSDLDEAVQQLMLIAIGGAYDSLSSANTPAQKREAIKHFWEGANYYRGTHTTRPMEVFYRRVAYANSHFNQLGPGWRTDRGKIYLIYGEPTNIEANPAYNVGSRPYQIWSYYDLNIRLYFVDQFMVSDYRLSGAFPPPGTFEWVREAGY